jgi:adenosine/AMP kinase
MASQQGNFPVNILLLLIAVADVSHVFSGTSELSCVIRENRDVPTGMVGSKVSDLRAHWICPLRQGLDCVFFATI